MVHWKTVARPREDQRISEHKQRIVGQLSAADAGSITRIQTPRNMPCPCGSRVKYKRCHLDKDQNAARASREIAGVEMSVAHLDRFERSIVQRDEIIGIQGLCKERTSPKYDNFTADNFLCDRWSGVQGASIAREGRALDATSEELKSRVGDGNDN